MVGVASTSKDKSIRVFNKKDHYYQWQFIYDPRTDKGGMLTTPNQPPLNIGNGSPGEPGGTGVGPSQNGQANPGQAAFGSAPGQPSSPPGFQPPQMPPEQ